MTKTDGREYKYSEQARILIESCGKFDIDDFEAWYKANVAHVIGSSFVLEYLMQRSAQAKQKGDEGHGIHE